MQDLSKMSDFSLLQRLIEVNVDNFSDSYRQSVFREIMHRLSLADKFKWLPIELAPKDGNWILIFTKNKKVFTAKWDGSFWFILKFKNEHYSILEENVTHFMYLPSPPEDKGE